MRLLPPVEPLWLERMQRRGLQWNQGAEHDRRVGEEQDVEVSSLNFHQ